MNTTCLTENEAAEFVYGRLTDDRLDSVTSHVEECDLCQETVVAIAEHSDTFIAELRSRQSADTPRPFEQEGALHDLMQRLSNPNDPTNEHTLAPFDTLETIGPYTLHEQLGSGGMGTVYRAIHERLKKQVAVKVLPQNRWRNSAATARFEREMEAIGSLDHDHIVAASDAGADDGLHYLAMEFIDGLDLSQVARRLGPLPVTDVCEIARQAALAIQYAHAKGLIHRDVKPSNLMLAKPKESNVGNQPSVKLLDLGLALLGDDQIAEEHELTTWGQVMGTIDYMAPEQASDSHDVDHRADIYGLGATLFKLLTGQAPFADPQRNTPVRKMSALATKSAPPIRDIMQNIPEPVAAVIDRMLSREPTDRFQKVSEVADALTPLADGADLGALLLRASAATEPYPSTTEPNACSRIRKNSGDDVVNIRILANPATSFGRRFPGWVVALSAGFLLLTAGMVFRFATDFGDITITSDDPNAVVLLKQENQTKRTLELSQESDNKFRIRAGNYTVEARGINVGVSVSPKSVEIKRGELSPLSVRSRPSASNISRSPKSASPPYGQYIPTEGSIDELASDDGLGMPDIQGDFPYDPPADDPLFGKKESQAEEFNPDALFSDFGKSSNGAATYQGALYEVWFEKLQSERELPVLRRAAQAVGVLPATRNDLEAATALLSVMRRYDRKLYLSKEANGRGLWELAETVRHSLTLLDAGTVIDACLFELKAKNRNSRNFVQHFIRKLTPEDRALNNAISSRNIDELAQAWMPPKNIDDVMFLAKLVSRYIDARAPALSDNLKGVLVEEFELQIEDMKEYQPPFGDNERPEFLDLISAVFKLDPDTPGLNVLLEKFPEASAASKFL